MRKKHIISISICLILLVSMSLFAFTGCDNQDNSPIAKKSFSIVGTWECDNYFSENSKDFGKTAIMELDNNGKVLKFNQWDKPSSANEFIWEYDNSNKVYKIGITEPIKYNHCKLKVIDENTLMYTDTTTEPELTYTYTRVK